MKKSENSESTRIARLAANRIKATLDDRAFVGTLSGVRLLSGWIRDTFYWPMALAPIYPNGEFDPNWVRNQRGDGQLCETLPNQVSYKEEIINTVSEALDEAVANFGKAMDRLVESVHVGNYELAQRLALDLCGEVKPIMATSRFLEDLRAGSYDRYDVEDDENQDVDPFAAAA